MKKEPRMSQLYLLAEYDPQAAKDIQSSFIFIMTRFMTLLMGCPCLFRAHNSGRFQARAVNV